MNWDQPWITSILIVVFLNCVVYKKKDSVPFSYMLIYPTTSWVAVGFDPDRMMKDTDILLKITIKGIISQ